MHVMCDLESKLQHISRAFPHFFNCESTRAQGAEHDSPNSFSYRRSYFKNRASCPCSFWETGLWAPALTFEIKKEILPDGKEVEAAGPLGVLKVDFGRNFRYVLPLLPCRSAIWRIFVFWDGSWFHSASPSRPGEERFGGVSVGCF